MLSSEFSLRYIDYKKGLKNVGSECLYTFSVYTEIMSCLADNSRYIGYDMGLGFVGRLSKGLRDVVPDGIKKAQYLLSLSIAFIGS